MNLPIRFLLSTLALAALPLTRAAETYQIAVIPKGTTHEFWKSIHAGAEKPGRSWRPRASP